jgi:hypothetical protein
VYNWSSWHSSLHHRPPKVLLSNKTHNSAAKFHLQQYAPGCTAFIGTSIKHISTTVFQNLQSMSFIVLSKTMIKRPFWKHNFCIEFWYSCYQVHTLNFYHTLGMVPTRYIGHILSSISINFSFFGFVEVVLRHFHQSCLRAARCGSFTGKVFSPLVVSSRWIRWTRRFTWFEPTERNTLHLRENWAVLCSSLPSLSLSFLFDPLEVAPTWAFYSSRSDGLQWTPKAW